MSKTAEKFEFILQTEHPTLAQLNEMNNLVHALWQQKTETIKAFNEVLWACLGENATKAEIVEKVGQMSKKLHNFTPSLQEIEEIWFASMDHAHNEANKIWKELKE